MTLKKWAFVALVLLLVMLGLLWVVDGYVSRSTQERLYDHTSAIPSQHAGLVLGTSPYLRNGRPNLYFTYRMAAAAQLYHAKRVAYLVVSGDNRRDDYNEPEAMQQALMTLGVPEQHIVLDFAGLRTLDSVVRMDKIFGQKDFIIISQRFHNERAVFIATQHGLNAYGYNAADVRLKTFALRNAVRETLARVKVLLDVWLGTQPRHLGAPIQLPPSPPSASANSDS